MKAGSLVGCVLVTWLSLAVISCSSRDDILAAENGIAEFRVLVASQEYGKIYATASEELHQSVKEADMITILTKLNVKLGRVVRAEKTGWSVNAHTSGTFVTIGLKTQFENGPGEERFIFRVVDGRAALVSYNVNSAVLLN